MPLGGKKENITSAAYARPKAHEVGKVDYNIKEAIKGFESSNVLGKTTKNTEHQLNIDLSKLPGSSFLEKDPTTGKLIAVNIDS